jgi:hypothetical protein
MRLFLDANVMTYIAVFEGFLIEGTAEELEEAVEFWKMVQGSEIDVALRREIDALRVIYLDDDRGRFDWLFSDLALAEIERISNVAKRQRHGSLLGRLIEHRMDVYAIEGRRRLQPAAIAKRVAALFPTLKPSMRSDAHQYCEAEMVGADYFVTNDVAFIHVGHDHSILRAGLCGQEHIAVERRFVRCGPTRSAADRPELGRRPPHGGSHRHVPQFAFELVEPVERAQGSDPNQLAAQLVVTDLADQCFVYADDRGQPALRLWVLPWMHDAPENAGVEDEPHQPPAGRATSPRCGSESGASSSTSQSGSATSLAFSQRVSIARTLAACSAASSSFERSGARGDGRLTT